MSAPFWGLTVLWRWHARETVGHSGSSCDRPGSSEIGRLADVERDGDRRYAGYDGVPAGFDDAVAPAVLEAGRQEGRLWVAVSMAGGGSGGLTRMMARSSVSPWPRSSTDRPTWPRCRSG